MTERLLRGRAAAFIGLSKVPLVTGSRSAGRVVLTGRSVPIGDRFDAWLLESSLSRNPREAAHSRAEHQPY